MKDAISGERRFISLSAKGGRDEQQDAAICLAAPDGAAALVVVSDGLGGESGGRIAAHQVIESAQQFWENHHGVFTHPSKDLEILCQTAHEQINLKGVETNTKPRATIVALYLTPVRAYWIHSGDSRLYRFRGGRFVQRTEDHSVVQLMVKQQLIKEEEQGSHASQSLLIQSLGGDEFRKPAADSAPIGPEDSFLLCTDGFWPQTTLEEMQELLYATDPDTAALLENAVTRAIERNGADSDNVTVALALPLDSSGSEMDEPLLAAMPLERRRTGYRKTFVVAGALVSLAAFVAAGVVGSEQLLRRTGVSGETGPKVEPGVTPVLVSEPPSEATDGSLPPSTQSTPQPLVKSSPEPSPSADQTALPVTAPSPTGGPSATTDTIDPLLVGKWQARLAGGIETWTQRSDGQYILAGPVEEAGTLTANNGKIRQYYPSRGMTQELAYEVGDELIVTTAPDGRKTEWHTPGALTIASPRAPHRLAPQRRSPEEIGIWERLRKLFFSH